MRTPTETADPMECTATLKDLQPSLERWLTTELEERIPAYFESFISLMIDAIIAKRTNQSVSKAMIHLSRDNPFLETLTYSIRREVDIRLPREEARALSPLIQNLPLAASERLNQTSIRLEWQQKLLGQLGINRYVSSSSPTFGDCRKVAGQDDGSRKGNRTTEHGFARRTEKYREANTKQEKSDSGGSS